MRLFTILIGLGVLLTACQTESTPVTTITPTIRVVQIPAITIPPRHTETPTPTITLTATPSPTASITPTQPTTTPSPVPATEDVPQSDDPTAASNTVSEVSNDTNTTENTESDTPEFEANAQVLADRGGLRLRRLPNTDSTVLFNLPANTDLMIQAKNGDGTWVLVQIPEGFVGWVWAAFLQIEVDLNTVEAIANPEPAPYFELSPPPIVIESYNSTITNITPRAREIFLNGQALGNRVNVFSKVGDSITVGTYFLYPFGWGTYNLGEFGYLLPTLQYFSQTNARDGNSFANISMAADNQWTSATILNPARANRNVCQQGETPLVCEYRVVKPAVALIMIGSNDLHSATNYSGNLQQIVQISIDMGVVPVLSTIPPRDGFDAQVVQYNDIIISTAQSYGIPLWDYYTAMLPLPSRGLSDGLHPSWPPGDFSQATVLTIENLNYGYALRNLMALQVLDAMRRQVLY